MQRRAQQQEMLAQQQARAAAGTAAQQRAMDIGPPEIAAGDIVTEKEIGSGSFGKVFSGKCREIDVAIKKLNKVTFDNKTLLTFKREVRIMSRIFHPNVCLFMGACLEPGNCMIVTELLPKGDLENLLHNDKIPLSDVQKLKIARDAALGMCWLHQSNPVFIHRDLKSSNLLLDDNLRVKVCDFGLSQLIPRDKKIKDTQNAKGTPLWMAPEVMQFREFNEACDLYSYGVVLWEIFTRQEPYKEFNSFDKFKHAICTLHHRPEIPESVPESIASIMRDCWAPDPTTRPSFAEVCQRLACVLLELALPGDTVAQQWWAASFGATTEDVDRAELVEKLAEFVAGGGAIAAVLEDGSSDNNNSSSNSAASAASEAVPPASPDTEMQDSSKGSEETDPSDPPPAAEGPSAGAAGELSELDRACLNALLDEIAEGNVTAEPKVTLDQFGRLLGWFGPLDKDIVLRIRETLSKVWFHGMISSQDAQMRLGGLPNGSYLVRLSTTTPGAYTISSLSRRDGTLRHQRVNYEFGEGGEPQLRYSQAVYPTLDAVIAATGYYPPAPGAKFQALFAAEPNLIVGYLES